jgi:hypothetical protein
MGVDMVLALFPRPEVDGVEQIVLRDLAVAPHRAVRGGVDEAEAAPEQDVAGVDRGQPPATPIRT